MHPVHSQSGPLKRKKRFQQSVENHEINKDCFYFWKMTWTNTKQNKHTTILNWLLKWRAVRPGLEWYLYFFGVNWQCCCWISNYLQRCQKRLEETWELQLSRCNKVLDFFLSLAIFNNRTDLSVKGKFRVKNNTCVSWTAAVGANCVVAVVMLLRQCPGCSLGLNFEFTISSCVRR